MTELDRAWAESQVESMADGSLSADAERRMLAAMARDPRLAQQVERARRLQDELRALRRVPVPRGMFWRLWRIPGRDRRTYGGFWLPAGALASFAVIALGFSLYLRTPEPALNEAEQAAAVQDFAVAVAYLQKSALMARNEVNQAVGSGVLSALEASAGMMDRAEQDSSAGEQDDD